MYPFRRFPVAMVATLSLVALAAVPRTASAQTLPTAKELMEKSDAMIGGRAALDKHTSFHQVGTMSVASANLEAQLELFKAKPSHYLQRIVLGAMGEVTQGFDGKNAWTVQPGQPPTLLDSATTETFKGLADFFGNFHDMSRYKSAENLGIVDFEGRKCYKVKIVKLSGSEGSEFYDVSTGLIAGIQAQADTPMGKIDQTSVFSDYKDAGGLKMPMKIQQKNGQFDASITFTAVEFDSVDPAVFTIPESLKAKAKP